MMPVVVPSAHVRFLEMSRSTTRNSSNKGELLIPDTGPADQYFSPNPFFFVLNQLEKSYPKNGSLIYLFRPAHFFKIIL
jgi:hypothetical protein